MAWTTPRTFVVGEIITAPILNTHVRDNLSFLSTHAHSGAAGDGSASLVATSIGAHSVTGLLTVTAGGINVTGGVGNGTAPVTNELGRFSALRGALSATSLTISGASDSAAQRDVIIQTNNAAGTGLVTRMTFGSNAASGSSSITSTERFLAPAGTGTGGTGLPTYSFTGDPNTGIWNPAADTLGFGLNGFTYVQITTTGIQLNNALNIYTVAGQSLTLTGGATGAGQAALLTLYAADHANAGLAILSTPNAASSANVTRMQISGNLTTAVVTWNASTHIGFVATNSIALGVAGSALGTLNINGNTSGTVSVTVAAAAGTWTLTLPPDDGDAGEQLQTNGSGVTTWEIAASSRAVKLIHGLLEPEVALRRILEMPVYRYHYDPEAKHVGGDYETEFYNGVAEEAPWMMQHKGRGFSPINAFGHSVAAFQALYQEIAELKQGVAGLKASISPVEVS